GMIGGAHNATRIELVTGSLSAAARKKALMRIASGEAGIIVGTHAVFYDGVDIPQLALVVVDEQHRFGVDQRSALGAQAHTLVMTATPIPRTVAMSVFGDLEVSVLRELPAWRKEVTTMVVPYDKQAWVERVWQRAREEIEKGGRVYVVCPRIDDQDGGAQSFEDDFVINGFTSLDVGGGENAKPLASVMNTAQMLSSVPALEGIGIGVMHGRLSSEEKSAAMNAFSSGQTPVLVSTTVIEVGVDVPEATMMIILDADRFGLSQLHQLRGRIGRGGRAGLCLALTGVLDGTLAAQRLEAFAATTDGFSLAEKDLELRGEGDILGANQSGRRSHIRFLSIIKDADIISAARQSARVLIERDPQLTSLPALADEISRLDEEQADYLVKS
ncbi:MAG: ATP-dependent DNA helicase RecG, partial [Actinomycetaceae bacterium]|nr:ATP-dependent DNA helicase RecG [Actinomycetaceae bacterium]